MEVILIKLSVAGMVECVGISPWVPSSLLAVPSLVSSAKVHGMRFSTLALQVFAVLWLCIELVVCSNKC